MWNRMKGSYKQVHIHKRPDYVIVLIRGHVGRKRLRESVETKWRRIQLRYREWKRIRR